MKNQKNNRNSLLVKRLTWTYHRNKLFLIENENGFKKGSSSRSIEDAYMIVYHIEYVVNKILDENDALIIRKEVIEKEASSWHKDYMSDSKYYKTRQRAYENFIKEVNE